MVSDGGLGIGLSRSFEADNIPLMIEAIPLPNECIILIITKVEDPEELDTRFSKFAPSPDSRREEILDLGNILPEGADNVLDIFRKLMEHHLKDSTKESRAEEAITLATELDLTQLYLFSGLDSVIDAAAVLKGFYRGSNSLYRLHKDSSYCLVIRKSNHNPEEFNKICNILSEYGTLERVSSASEAYLEEHFTPLIKNSALQSLAEI